MTVIHGFCDFVFGFLTRNAFTGGRRIGLCAIAGDVAFDVARRGPQAWMGMLVELSRSSLRSAEGVERVVGVGIKREYVVKVGVSTRDCNSNYRKLKAQVVDAGNSDGSCTRLGPLADFGKLASRLFIGCSVGKSTNPRWGNEDVGIRETLKYPH